MVRSISLRKAFEWLIHLFPVLHITILGLQTRIKTEVGNLIPFSMVNGIRVFVHNQTEKVRDMAETPGYVASPGYRNNYGVRYVSTRSVNQGEPGRTTLMFHFAHCRFFKL